MRTTEPSGPPTVLAPLRAASALPPPPPVPYEFNSCLRFNRYEPSLDPLRVLFPLRPFDETD